MVKPTEDRLCHHAMAFGDLMPILQPRHGQTFRRIWDIRPKTRMRPAPVVVLDPFGEQDSQVFFTKGNQIIETFSSDCAVQPLTKRICKWRHDGRLEHFYAHVFDRSVEIRRENRVAIVNQVVIFVITRDRLPELLLCPTGRWVRSHIEMNNPPRSDLHHDKNVQFGKPHSPYGQKIASKHHLRVIVASVYPLMLQNTLSCAKTPVQALKRRFVRIAPSRVQR
jgi:hypothetical protein